MVVSDASADWLLAGEDRAAEQRFYETDPKARALGEEIEALEGRLAAERNALARAGEPAPIDLVAHLFGLNPFETEVLALLLAPEIDPAFERLYAYVQDDPARKYATADLALTLFGDPEGADASLRDSFLPDAPLRRFRLVTVEPPPSPGVPLATRPLRLESRVLDYLRGANRLDDEAALLLKPPPPAPIAPHHAEIVDRLLSALAPHAREGSLPLVNLWGPPGAGKRAVARALCERVGLSLVALDARGLPTTAQERESAIRLLEREATLSRLAIYVDASAVDGNDKPAAEALANLVERLRAFVIVGSADRWRAARALLPARVTRAAAAGQRAMWRTTLGVDADSLAETIEAILQQFDLSPEAIARAVAAARGRALVREAGTARLTPDDLWSACREESGWQLDDLAERIEATHDWEDLVLPEEAMRPLKEIADQVALRPTVYESWGFGRKLNRGRGITALFAGPSGTGKTLAAEVLASELGLDLYRIDLAGVVNKYIGETEKNLRRIFHAAQESGAILFFDEADALFGKRSDVKDSHDRYANIEVNYLLQLMEDYRGLAILATNRKSSLDTAFLRRIRFLVDFPFPDAQSRRRIWEKAFPKNTPTLALDLDALVRLEIPGGNIRNVALNAAFLAAGEGAPVGMQHVMHAARREYAKMEKMVSEAEFGAYGKKVKR